MPIKVRELMRLIEQDGWYHVRTSGSHHHFYPPTKPGTVTIPAKPGKDVPEGTKNSALRQAGLK